MSVNDRVTPARRTDRLYINQLPRAEWEAVRLACFERDDFTCQECGSTDELQPDHIKPLVDYPELALDLDNLRTLCGPCNRRKSDTEAEGPTRMPWCHPDYLDLADLVFPTAN